MAGSRLPQWHPGPVIVAGPEFRAVSLTPRASELGFSVARQGTRTMNLPTIADLLSKRHNETPVVGASTTILRTRDGGAASLTVDDLRHFGYNAFSFRVKGGWYEITVMNK